MLAHRHVVEDGRRGPGVGGAAVAAARPTVQRRLVGIVLGGAAVTAQHHQRREVGRQAHHGQGCLGEELPVLDGEPLGDAQPGGGDGADSAAQPVSHAVVQARRDRLDGGQRPGRPAGDLGEAERREGVVLGRVEGVLAGGQGHPARAGARQTALGNRRVGVFGDLVARAQQHRALLAAGRGLPATVGDGDREESGEAQRFVRPECLHLAAQLLGAGVDAADDLGCGPGGRRGQRLPGQFGEQRGAVSPLVGALPDQRTDRHPQQLEHVGDGVDTGPVARLRGRQAGGDGHRAGVRRRGLGCRRGRRAGGVEQARVAQQFSFVDQPHRQVLGEVGGVAVLAVPAHVTGPAGHRGEVGPQVAHPRVVAHTQVGQGRGGGVVGAGGQ